MKILTPRRASGFTLVELLVVIAIIAVLASAGFAAGNAAIQKAKRVKAQATATAVETAVNNFFTEYGTMPAENLTAMPIETDDVQFLSVLLGTETGTSPLNTRGIKFLSVKEGKKKGSKGMDGLVYEGNSNKPTGLYDPWGGVYKVAMDHDYDERVDAKPKASSTTKTLNGRRVAVWSDGADGVDGGGKAADDVKTWD